MTGICLAGSLIVDRINRISQYPTRGELAHIISSSRACGGLVANDSLDLKRMDPSLEIYACGKVGADSDGEFVVNILRSAGVDTSLINIAEGTITSFTNVYSEDAGERTFFCMPGGSAELGFDDIPFDKLDCKMFHLGYFLLLDKIDNGDGLSILKELTERGIKTSIDFVTVSPERYGGAIPCLKYVGNLIVNELEASRLAGIEYDGSNMEQIMLALKQYGVRERVIVHEPSRGSILSDNGFHSLNSLKLPQGWIKGTTGAGDAFCSGALYAIYNDWDDLSLLQFASQCAAVSLRSADATGAMCTVSEIRTICKNLERL